MVSRAGSFRVEIRAATAVGFTCLMLLGAPAFGEKGDVNEDGALDSTDTMYIRQAVHGERSLSTEESLAADVAPFDGIGAPGDGHVDAADLSVHMRALAGEDLDGDGLGIRAERESQNSPFLRDTDQDGVWDGDEDADGDGLLNWEEQALGSALNDASGLGGADATYTPVVPAPRYPTGQGPRVRFYASRPNAHAATGRLEKLRELLEADGYQVGDITLPPLEQTLSTIADCTGACVDYKDALAGTEIFVLVEPDEPISAAEASALAVLLEDAGASVLVLAESGATVGALVGDYWGIEFVGDRVTHSPPSCPGASKSCPSGWSTFRLDDQTLLPGHPVVAGAAASDAVSTFTSFLGGSMQGQGLPRYMPDTRFLAQYSSIATLGSSAVHRVSSELTSADGLSQAIALESGRGVCRPLRATRRWFVSADVEAFTAVADQAGRRRGLQIVSHGANAQLVLNVFRWLDLGLDPVPPLWELHTASSPCVNGLGQGGQWRDFYYSPAVPAGSYQAGTGPRILVDSSHSNASTLGLLGRFAGFGALAEADGYVVEDSPHRFDTGAFDEQIDGARLLVMVNPGVPILAPEFQRVIDFVEGGGALLFVIDHHPFPSNVSDAAALLGIEFVSSVGEAEIYGVRVDPTVCAPSPPGCRIGNVVFARDPLSDAEGTLFDRATIIGRSPAERVDQTRIFAGSAFRLLPTAPSIGVHRVVAQYPDLARFTTIGGAGTPPASGYLHAMEIEIGQGRVFVASEAAMLTAQIRGLTHLLDEDGEPVVDENEDPIFVPWGRLGINSEPGNEQLVLNVIRWLDGLY